MGKESWVDSSHVRVTSSDGKTSYLYSVDNLGTKTCVEIAHHHSNGTTDAYEPGDDLDLLFGDGTGEQKNDPDSESSSEGGGFFSWFR